MSCAAVVSPASAGAVPFDAWTTDRAERFEAAAQRMLPAADAVPQRLHQAMRYAVLDGGKRVRPLLVYAGGGVTGEGNGVGRAELVGQFLLNPRTTQLGGYAGGGLAGVFANGADNGYLVLMVGIESRPGGRGGWFVEAGVGGGARFAAGYRWRKLPPGWRVQR